MKWYTLIIPYQGGPWYSPSREKIYTTYEKYIKEQNKIYEMHGYKIRIS